MSEEKVILNNKEISKKEFQEKVEKLEKKQGVVIREKSEGNYITEIRG